MMYDNNLDKRKVMVMNQTTWEDILEQTTNDALESHDPIGFVGRFTGIDVEIDDDLPDYHVEVYERWMLEAVRKYGKASEE